MSLKFQNIYHQLPLSPPHSKTPRKFSILHRRAWKRRKLKLKSTQTFSVSIRNHFNFNFFDSSPFENFFQSLISQFPSSSSLDLLAPALGLASGAAIYFSQSDEKSGLMRFLRKQRNNKSVGEWILFTSPTPFNRFVVLRCPSISFEGSELLEDMNEKLVKEDRHFVRLNKGRIQVREEEVEEAEKLVYQRVCLRTEDGGVLSLDWPANLDLEEERGLDTTILIVPGTAEGSMEKDIREFVCECLRRGCFPVVMNPRGCAGSPLTTPRLFTAADSDDISTVIQFINKARPWTTVMGVAWGYGANMLTKYLAEVGEKTSLTAATCIDNPFDLEEATRSTPYHILLDKKLKSGLIEILRSNRELFQGRAKGFDVEKALLSTSVRDFEKAISMVSYGFDEIEDFYAKSSTRDMVGKVKIPLLFIQNDNGAVPLFSTPRSLIAENPFTSLLLCSYLPSKEVTSSRSNASWCQHLSIEWLTAVELGLLKGRHPLLKDVDVTINPSKGLAMVEGRTSYKNGRVNKLLHVSNFDTLDAYRLNPAKEMFEAGDTAVNIHSRSRQESKGLRPQIKDSSEDNRFVGAELVGEEVVYHDKGEMGQVLQTAKVVMNMLDATMPDTLTEEQKKKVLTAVGRGETIMKAFQDAVPEDVRGKLTSAVSGILHNEESNLKIDRLLSLGRIPDVASRLKSKIQEKDELPNSNSENEDPHTSAQTQRVDDLTDGPDRNQTSKDKASLGPESEFQASEYLPKPVDSDQVQPMIGQAGEIFDSDKKATNDLGNHKENADSFRTGLASDSRETGLETIPMPKVPSGSEGAGSAEDITIEQHKDHDSKKGQSSMEGESINQNNEVKTAESSVDQTKNVPSAQTEDKSSTPISLSESQSVEKEGDNSFKREESRAHAGSTEYDSKLPTFDVSKALDALTEIDDSTQVAVNSVFNVIEDVISQLEEGRDNANEAKDGTSENKDKAKNTGYEFKERGEVQDQKFGSIHEDKFSDDNLERLEDHRNGKSRHSDGSFNTHFPKQLISEEESARDPVIGSGSNSDVSWESHPKSHEKEGNGNKKDFPSRKPLTENPAKYISSFSQPNPMSITTKLYGDPLSEEYLQKYMMLKMRNTRMLDLDTETSLFLEYSPEEGQWKLLELSEDNSETIHEDADHVEVGTEVQTNLGSGAEDTDNIIETSYAILDSDGQLEQCEKCETTNNFSVEIDDDTFEKLLFFVKSIILDALKVEVERRLSATDIEEIQPKLAKDLELVANAVCLSVGHEEHIFFMKGRDNRLDKFGTIEGQHVIRAITSTVPETSYLRGVLPVGVIVGSCLAALRKYFHVATTNSDSQSEDMILEKSRDINHTQLTMKEADKMVSENIYQKDDLVSSVEKCSETTEADSSNGKTVVVGAVTAALGASALLVEQKGSGTTETLCEPLEEKRGYFKEPRNEEEISEKTQNNFSLVTSLAEKAMSVAAPVVPTKEDGEVDHERLVAMLAEWGQKGGMLKLVGKIALLWGGIRGALSLTDRLISFLHVAERPLYQRIFGFVLMVLVLWSPVVVPLLPTLVQNWATHNSPRIAELACLLGLYVSIMLMVTRWGKRIRGYDNPLEQYGLDLTSPSKVLNFVNGLIGGVMLVLLIHSANFFCGFVQPSWPTYRPLSSSDAVKLFKVCGRILLLLFRGLVTATSIAVVEELLFRSWLPDEIAADFGYYHGIVISGLAFSLSQRSPWAIPGLWLLSLGLAGARQRSKGSLSLPIGLRAGIIVSSFILQRAGFLTYRPSIPVWLCGSHPFEPFSGIVGLVFSLPLAIILYPRQPLLKRR